MTLRRFYLLRHTWQASGTRLRFELPPPIVGSSILLFSCWSVAMPHKYIASNYRSKCSRKGGRRVIPPLLVAAIPFTLVPPFHPRWERCEILLAVPRPAKAVLNLYVIFSPTPAQLQKGRWQTATWNWGLVLIQMDEVWYKRHAVLVACTLPPVEIRGVNWTGQKFRLYTFQNKGPQLFCWSRVGPDQCVFEAIWGHVRKVKSSKLTLAMVGNWEKRIQGDNFRMSWGRRWRIRPIKVWVSMIGRVFLFFP